MALIDIVKFQGNDEEFVWKFPSENLRWGTQLVVKPAQMAFFVKGGKILDEFKEGTVTLKSGNIPLLTKLLSLPFGGDTPFQAEVWFVNLITKLNTPWGLPRAIQLEDPKYGVVVPVRTYGQFGFRVAEPRKFFETIVGTAKVFTAVQITDYFRGLMLSSVSSNIGKAVVKQNISLLQISAFLDELSAFCREKVGDDFGKFGLELINFYFQSINIPDEDPSYIRLKQIKEKAAELNVIGRDIYQFDKSMDVLKTAAGNEGAGSTLMQTGMGLGMGMMIGNQVGQQAGQMITQLPPGATPPLPVVVKFHVSVGNQDIGETELEAIKKLVGEGKVNRKTLVWRDGMASWQEAESQAELKGLFESQPPALPPVA